MTEIAARRKSLSERTVATARQVLAGQRGGVRAYLAFAGPAVIASIAYMDPGNFATNIQAGAKYGYGLLWVVLLANLIAMLFQALSAKLGIVTGRNLAEMCRDQFPRPVVWAMWVVSEIAAMATDLAEFLGGAIGLSLLFQTPLLVGMIITGIVTYGILMFEGFGFRPIELIIGSLVSLIALCYLVETVHCSGRLGLCGVSHRRTADRRRGGALAFGRHHRRNRDAARGLPAFRPNAIAHAGPRQYRAAQSAALLQPGSHHRARRRRARQHGHGDDGVGCVPRRPSRGCRNRKRLSHADAAARGRRGRRVFAVAHRLGSIELDGRNNGRPIDHARASSGSKSRSGCVGSSP